MCIRILSHTEVIEPSKSFLVRATVQAVLKRGILRPLACCLIWEKSWNMQKKIASRKKTLVFSALACTVLIVVAVFIHSLFPSRFPVWVETISKIVSNPAAWDNRTVKVEGTIQRTMLGVVLPFNYWLSEKENQTMRIGVKWYTDADLSGKNVNVIGVVRKGYAWVHPNDPGWWVYFIDANSVYFS